jgi:hypothetical protein
MKREIEEEAKTFGEERFGKCVNSQDSPLHIRQSGRSGEEELALAIGGRRF